MGGISKGIGNELEHGSAALGRIHNCSNNRKAMAYWLGFLKGVLASKHVETAEFSPLKVEAENFLALLKDDDAKELIEDLAIWQNEPREILQLFKISSIFVPESFSLNLRTTKSTRCMGFAPELPATTISRSKRLKLCSGDWIPTQEFNATAGLGTSNQQRKTRLRMARSLQKSPTTFVNG